VLLLLVLLELAHSAKQLAAILALIRKFRYITVLLSIREKRDHRQKAMKGLVFDRKVEDKSLRFVGAKTFATVTAFDVLNDIRRRRKAHIATQ
jgi:hypothetical protein